jgi:hypothetical protein
MASRMTHSISSPERTRGSAWRTLPARQGIPGTSRRSTDSSACLYTRRIPCIVRRRKGTSFFLWPLAHTPAALAQDEECSRLSTREHSLRHPSCSGLLLPISILRSLPNVHLHRLGYTAWQLRWSATRSVMTCLSSLSKLLPLSQVLWGAP